MAGLSTGERERGAKVIVLKALSGNPRLPYFALLTQGFPRLTPVSAAALLRDDDAGTLPEAVLAQVRLREDRAMIPDLNRVESLLSQVLQQAA